MTERVTNEAINKAAGHLSEMLEQPVEIVAKNGRYFFMIEQRHGGLTYLCSVGFAKANVLAVADAMACVLYMQYKLQNMPEESS